MASIKTLYKKIRNTCSNIDYLTEQCKKQDDIFNNVGNEFLNDYVEYANHVNKKYQEEMEGNERLDNFDIENIYQRVAQYKNEIDEIVKKYNTASQMSEKLQTEIQKFTLAEDENDIIDNSGFLEDLFLENLQLSKIMDKLKQDANISTTFTSAINPLSPW
eukprot:NODE_107_length_19843_cov_0.502077.p12 type:complete len:161 gc:universal NODE_107_length_19843_cov_0.502077:10447-9965(-)